MQSNAMIGGGNMLIEPVIEVVPMNEYNAAEAKCKASIKWLLAQAFGNNVPDEFADPFYSCDSQGEAHLRPVVLNALAAGDVYALAASNILHDETLAYEGHRAILQSMNRLLGHEANGDRGQITETALRQISPFRINCHLTIIDQLMAILAKTIVRREVVSTVCRKLVPEQSADQPSDVLCWINKVCEVVRSRVESAAAASGREAPIIPEMDDVYEDICDGACIAAVISYYRPEDLKFDDVCFNDPMSLADCIHNLWLVKEFCAERLPCNIFHFTYEDVLYTHESLKPNLNVFLAELFHNLAGVTVTERPAALITRHRIGNRMSQHIPASSGNVSSQNKPARINSIDSLVADASKKKNKSDRDGSWGARPVATVSFMDIPSSSSFSAGHNMAKEKKLPPAYGRSDTMPCVNLHSTPSLVRMQLEEKRRLYEVNRMKRQSELAEQRQKMSKMAFFIARNKEAEAASAEGRKRMESQVGQPSARHSVSDLDELAKYIKEMQEQMKCLLVEQENLKELVKSKHESTLLLPTSSQAAAVSLTANAGQLLSAQSLLCLPTSLLDHVKIPSSVKNGPQADLLPEAPVERVEKDQSFLLHEAGKRDSHLDPSLDISKSTSGLSMSCNGKKKRRTWKSLMEEERNGDDQECTVSMIDLPTKQEADFAKAQSNDVQSTPSPRIAAVKAQQAVSKSGGSSPAIGFVVGEQDVSADEQEILRKRKQKLEAVLRRREEAEQRREKIEEENALRRAQLQERLQDQERRKRERELKRQKVLQEYQRKRAEQDATEAGAASTSHVGVGHRRTPRSSSQMALNQSKLSDSTSTSLCKVMPMNTTTSMSELDQMDNDTSTTEVVSAEPALKLYVKPVQRSNRTIVYNAIQYSVLVGAVNAETKSKVLMELARSDGKQFLILFRDQKCQYRGLYSWDQMSERVHKLHGVGPKYCDESIISQLFKYDSGSKQFSSIPSRHLLTTIDGFTLKEEYWQKKGGATPRR